MWYCQIMALFRCSLGDYAVVRYCIVLKDRNQMERDGMLCRPCLAFELEKNKQGMIVCKYDVVEIQVLLPSFERTEMKRPPYMAPMFGVSGTSSDKHDSTRLLDAEFF
jgi:hypothetical protein